MAGLGLAAGACESGAPLVRLGDGHPRDLLLLSSHEASAVLDFLDSATRLILLTSLVEFSAGLFGASAFTACLFWAEQFRFPGLVWLRWVSAS